MNHPITTPPAPPAIPREPDVLVTIAEHRPIKGKGPMGFDTWLGEESLVVDHAVPMCESCRVLLARGITGRVGFCDPGSPFPRMTMDIEAGAKLTVVEKASGGPRLIGYATADVSEATASGRSTSAEGDDAPEPIPTFAKSLADGGVITAEEAAEQDRDYLEVAE